MAARLPDYETLLATGAYARRGSKEEIKKVLRIQDEQQYVNRFTWYNLPNGLTGQKIERILYYRGQAMFFYLEALDQFYFLPFVGKDNIDVYGEYHHFTPLPFHGASEEIDPNTKKPKEWITGLTYTNVDSIKLEELEEKDILESCVLLYDYTKQVPQVIIPRQQLAEELIDLEAEMIPFMRTALMNETGIEGVRVNNEDEYSNVKELNKQIKNSALNGERYLATVGAVEFQEMPCKALGTPADFMQAMESIDNFRLSALGIDSNGLFAKKAHMLETEQAMAGGASGLIFDDSLKNRQHFCDVVNSIWGLGIWCEPSENVTGDMNGDGMIADTQDQTGNEEGEQPQINEENN